MLIQSFFVIFIVTIIFGCTIGFKRTRPHIEYSKSKSKKINLSHQNQNLVSNTSNWRLPTSVIPKKYDLYLYPNLKTGLFNGKVTVTLVATENTHKITLHSKNLKINSVQLDGRAANAEANEEFETLTVSLNNGAIIRKGEHELTITYSGDMKNGINGFYRSSYTTEDGEKHYIATSHMQPTSARKAFPCFDEPNMKATFTMHILKPTDDDESYVALSNMPQQGKEIIEKQGAMVDFKESVQISTYLAAFVVGDFKYTETVFNSGSGDIPLRVYASPAQVEKTHYVLEVAKGVAEFYTEYFDMEYPLPKLDLIAIPDFEAGAMENWGLVTFRETSLLYDEEKSSTANKLRVATVVAHELAHSWFGNLVTMRWWNDLWLNEGFASYIEYKGVDAVHPEWQMLDQFLLEDLHPVLSLDATSASHPIIKNVVTPDQITEVFDYITYHKGASLLRMLEASVGEDKFQKAVRVYLHKYGWANAETQDLWNELQSVVGYSRNVTTFMDTWTVQMGYPILCVQEEKDHYVLTQQRFLKDSVTNEKSESFYGYKWTIPVTYITNKDQENAKLVWFDHYADKLIIEKPYDIKWIKFNHKQIGYYRVNYQEETWQLLGNNINDMLSISDKTHLLEESFSIAESNGNYLGYNVPLDLTKNLRSETHYLPWSVATNKLHNLKIYLADSLAYSKYMEYLESIVQPAYDSMGWDEESNDDFLKMRARVTILKFACSIDYHDCKEEALRRFNHWLENPQAHMVPDLRPIIYTYGMQKSGKNEWKKLLEIYKKEIDASEKINLLRGLASVKDIYLLRRLIELAKDEDIVRGQDYFTMLEFVSYNPVGTLMVWDYVRENWSNLVARFGLNDPFLGKMVTKITKTFVTKTKLKEMEDFFAANPEAGAGKAARLEALAQVKNNIQWIERNKEDVVKWINENAAEPTYQKRLFYSFY